MQYADTNVNSRKWTGMATTALAESTPTSHQEGKVTCCASRRPFVEVDQALRAVKDKDGADSKTEFPTGVTIRSVTNTTWRALHTDIPLLEGDALNKSMRSLRKGFVSTPWRPNFLIPEMSSHTYLLRCCYYVCILFYCTEEILIRTDTF
jgi:hypothetical protein